MAWTIGRIKKELERLSAAKNDTFSVPVIINNRITRTLGRAMYDYAGKDSQGYLYSAKSIEISKQLLETASDETIIGVIRHEWAHYYLVKKTHRNQGHNSMFKALCDEIGTWGTTGTVVVRVKEVKHKYDFFCTKCGKLTSSCDRKSFKTDHPECYSSRCCGEHIRVQKNW